ncbi:uncharacterized protein TM35_000461410 [Trypanosoma theileri]|uniref:Uncharacterized protein n=1 Tax=Trypanosoma theileri TaxID=67003 RepID=A0A1X0NHT6_9TRYP|nr:uncharacterized protein TM35_000461410 [Trypanosoma theileri]ORC84322.1 hypothetical protein TM35_000461410 [Trypanosoma theileri]
MSMGKISLHKEEGSTSALDSGTFFKNASEGISVPLHDSTQNENKDGSPLAMARGSDSANGHPQQDQPREGQLTEEENSPGLRSGAPEEKMQTSTGRSKKKISWRCGMCGYHVLAMDQEGNPLPLSVSPFGEVLPMSCPRCLLEHTSWEQAVPFDEHGDHTNIRSKLSNNYVRTTAKENGPVKDFHPPPTSSASGVQTEKVEIPPILEEIGRWTYKDGVPKPTVPEVSRPRGTRMAYYCGKCDRQLLRMDPYGELVPMVRDKDGVLLPILCPGCKEEHNQWEVKPYKVTR